MLLQTGVVHNVVINDIRPGIVASAGFVVQVIIEPLFVDAGAGPEFLLPTVLFFFVFFFQAEDGIRDSDT